MTGDQLRKAMAKSRKKAARRIETLLATMDMVQSKFSSMSQDEQSEGFAAAKRLADMERVRDRQRRY